MYYEVPSPQALETLTISVHVQSKGIQFDSLIPICHLFNFRLLCSLLGSPGNSVFSPLFTIGHTNNSNNSCLFSFLPHVVVVVTTSDHKCKNIFFSQKSGRLRGAITVGKKQKPHTIVNDVTFTSLTFKISCKWFLNLLISFTGRFLRTTCSASSQFSPNATSSASKIMATRGCCQTIT